MPDQNREGKLNDVQREFILRCLASGFGPVDTADFVKDEFGIQITRQNVDYYRKAYPDEIKTLREELTRNLMRIPFANRLNRIALLDRMVSKHLRGRRWVELRNTLKEIREEADGIASTADAETGNFTDALTTAAAQVWTGEGETE